MNAHHRSEVAPPPGTRADLFATTRWTVVLAAGDRQTPQASRALEELCRTYWFPLYAYVRRRGHSKEDAEDLTQAFFARFLEKDYLADLSAERGKFRAFLLAALKCFLANEWDKSRCWKRGGRAGHVSLDRRSAEAQFQIAATSSGNPDKAFDREWALALLDAALAKLAAEWQARGRAAQFNRLKEFLTAANDPTSSYTDAAATLGMDEGTLRVAVHRLRKRYRQVLRDEITQTLTDPTQSEEEMRTLFEAFGRGN